MRGYQNVIDVYPDSKAAKAAQQAIERLTKKQLEAPTPEIGPSGSADRPSLDGGTVTLAASKAVIHGTEARYEFAQDRDNIGFWGKEEEWVSWDLTASKTGTFTVEVTYAADPGCGGNEFTLAIGDQQVSGKVRSTGGWGTFETEAVGTIRVTQMGDLTVIVKPKGKPNIGLMNLKAVTLKRAAD